MKRLSLIFLVVLTCLTTMQTIVSAKDKKHDDKKHHDKKHDAKDDDHGKDQNCNINLNGPAYTSANPLAKSGYGGQCTAFAWGRVFEVTGKKLNTTSNAKNWFNATNLPKGSKPKRNSIAVWSGDNINPYGHVAFVEDVDRNGNITINEANFKNYKNSTYGGGYDGSPKTLSEDKMNNRKGAGKLVGYIYVD